MPAESRAEELAAYAIDYREAAPVGIRAAIDNIVGSVKTWLQKTFGVQLGSPTPGELVALAKAALRDGWQPTDGGPDGGSKENVDPSFEKNIDDLARGKEFGRPITVGSTPAVLLSLGAQDAPLQIAESAVWKSITDHAMTPNVIKAAIRGLYRPIMVFKSATTGDSFVSLVEVTDKGKPVVVAVHINMRERTTVHRISTIHQRPVGQMENWVDQGLLKYRDNEKAAAWSRSTGLQLPKEGAKRRPEEKVLHPSDVFNPDGSPKARKLNRAMPGGTPPAAPPKLTMRERTSNLLTSAMRGDSKGDYRLLSMTPLRQLVQEVAFPFQTPRGRPLIHAGPQGPSATSALRPHLGHCP